MVYKLFDKKSSVGVIKNENFSNKELAEELHKPITKKSRKEKYQERKGTLTFYRQYLGCWSCRYAINKQI